MGAADPVSLGKEVLKGSTNEDTSAADKRRHFNQGNFSQDFRQLRIVFCLVGKG